LRGSADLRLSHPYPAGRIVPKIDSVGGSAGKRCQQIGGFIAGDHYHPDHLAVFKVGNINYRIAGERVSRNTVSPGQILNGSHIRNAFPYRSADR
jgi:hypothetical protein